jgi:hypothetical protein
MGYSWNAGDLRNLLAVASKLRQLADDTLCQGDRSLYLTAAQALETRAERLASSLPQGCHDLDSDPRLHQPVDMVV